MGPDTERSLRGLLDEVAAATPAPGGGSAAAWTCALAAALVQMTAAFTLARPDAADRHERMREIAAQAEAQRHSAIELAERELESFTPVLTALRLPAGEERSRAVDRALSAAAETPLAIARLAAGLAALALEARELATPHLRADALAGLLLAEGACQASAVLVATNLRDRPQDERLGELGELTRCAAAARGRASGGPTSRAYRPGP